MSDNANEIIALAVDPKRKGWTWLDCPKRTMSLRDGGRKINYGCPSDCPTCNGAGRVPVALEKPEYTLKLARVRRELVDDYAATSEGYLMFRVMGSIVYDGVSEESVGEEVRDLVAEGIIAAAKEKS